MTSLTEIIDAINEAKGGLADAERAYLDNAASQLRLAIRARTRRQKAEARERAAQAERERQEAIGEARAKLSNLTDPQQTVLSQFVTESHVTAESLSSLCGMDTGVVTRVLRALEVKGYVTEWHRNGPSEWNATDTGDVMAQVICDQLFAAV
jgi:ribosomal protein S25